MKMAYCWKCQFKMVIRKHTPKACPACGFDRSDEVMEYERQYQAKLKAEKEAASMGTQVPGLDLSGDPEGK